MATKSATQTGSNWVLIAAWAALVAIVASYYYSHAMIRKVNMLIEGLESYVKVNVSR